ncbi:glutamine amidotransferase [Anseongella ginsenosidimutans]|uniref:Imidazole glycerol phosphate synthase subunit HisH n=1 Tax=Anseongella ginsenosidimutans TaxID=496056 RepID=A0A4R3KRQ7_9SPHI|nr:imidazole glycerol phosphate synthase subunit HisH [Anseongella ginsenosidimutans]QEC52971.1 imidazole glycerol phosphate synthase subunit HisH [Anseongella ginsenosidimutans]TCS87374.1 glutamine amidotransferase [Anseongella ginsenosidimutans]
MTGIVYYGAGNLFSLQCSLDRIGEKYGLITSAEQFEGFERYIIPGVGHAGAAMQKLEGTGLIPLIRETKKPLLGVCLGMQLLTAQSEEGNSTLCNIIPLRTRRFIKDGGLKIPHTGWNKVRVERAGPLYEGIPDDSQFYFVHSYYIELNSNFTLTSTEYGITFSSSIMKDNFFGVQFHPEKSGEAGEQLLKNFTRI